ncbi:hypothetical protein RRK63_004312 [Vibrio fluvialis]|nr:hypothetical protein [Vibrio fluvialis]
MANYKKNKAHLRVVTTRLDLGDYAALIEEAENQGSNPAQMMRTAWSSYKENQSINSRINELESRLTRKIFEIVVAVAGLSCHERKLAMKEVNKRLQESK